MITLAQEKDLQEILDLYKRCSDHVMKRYNRTQWTEHFDEKEYLDKIQNNLIYIMKDKETLVSSFILEVEYPNYISNMDNLPFRYLKKLAVDPQYQSQGIGYRMMKHAENISKDLGATVLRMDFRSNFEHLRAFYQRLMYQEIGLAYIEDIEVMVIEKIL